jgi:hypothetical protein
MTIYTNKEHTEMALRNRRLLKYYHVAMRDGDFKNLKRIKRQLELEIMKQGHSKNVRFLKLVLDNVSKKLEVA